MSWKTNFYINRDLVRNTNLKRKWTIQWYKTHRSNKIWMHFKINDININIYHRLRIEMVNWTHGYIVLRHNYNWRNIIKEKVLLKIQIKLILIQFWKTVMNKVQLDLPRIMAYHSTLVHNWNLNFPEIKVIWIIDWVIVWKILIWFDIN